MKLEILSFDGELFKSNDVVSLSVITKSGEITILKEHSPLITGIVPGVLSVTYKEANGKNKEDQFAVGRGILEIGENHIKVLIDMLVDSEQLDMEKAEKAREEAIELMKKYKNSKDQVDMEKFIEAEDQLLKSIAQLKMGKK